MGIKKLFIYLSFVVLIFFSLHLSSCREAPPDHIENVCSIFRQYPKWYWESQHVQERWGVPIPVLMAVIYQESRFRATAKPPRERLLWIIPWFRPTSAYGYSQAIRDTWRRYKRSTNHTFASREAFDDAADFIGWYADQAYRYAGISKANAYQVYLAYHEGVNGYRYKTYLRKKWLVLVARKVQVRSLVYRSQLKQCEANLPRKPFWRFW